MTEDDILDLIKNDEWMMDILKTAKSLNLPDWWIGAGFVRSKVWDHLHNYKTRTPVPDVDLIYLDKKDFSKGAEEAEKIEKSYEEQLNKLFPGVKWSVKNQARMHLLHNHKPYRSSTEALSYWVETATCVGVKLDDKNNLVLTAPRGVYDLVNLILRPAADFSKDTGKFEERIENKKWLTKWPKLKVVNKNLTPRVG